MRECIKHNLLIRLPAVSDEHFGVTTISDAPIPENAIVGELNLVTVVLLRVLAELTSEARGGKTTHPNSVSHLEIPHIAPHHCNHTCYLMSEKETDNHSIQIIILNFLKAQLTQIVYIPCDCVCVCGLNLF